MPSAVLDRIKGFVDFYPTCPEVEIGLGVPREPIRLAKMEERLRLISSVNGNDVTERMTAFADSFLSQLSQVDGFVLKSRSPSCGTKDVKVYTAAGKAPVVGKAPGFFGAAVLGRFPGLAIEDEGRLRNFEIREHFLTRVFIRARFREVTERPTMSALVDFHSRNKLLLSAYSPHVTGRLGRIVANLDRKSPPEVASGYLAGLDGAFPRTARPGTYVNVLHHTLGHFSKVLSAREKAFFLELVERYKGHKVPLSVLLGQLETWAVRFDDEYLAHQTLFRPYPVGLQDVLDSGKGRPID